MTHDDLCRLGAEWLFRRHRCALVAWDVRGIMLAEQPDAVGWSTSGQSYLVEAKVSRADFFRGMKKPHMRTGAPGIGCWRWFITPAGLIGVNELPPRWGLIEVGAGGRARQVHASKLFPPERVSRAAETAALVWIHRLCPRDRVLLRERVS